MQKKQQKTWCGKVEKSIQSLEHSPKLYAEIDKSDELKRIYRRIVIKNFVILYTIDENDSVVYVSHMYYGGRNYLDNSLL